METNKVEIIAAHKKIRELQEKLKLSKRRINLYKIVTAKILKVNLLVLFIMKMVII